MARRAKLGVEQAGSRAPKAFGGSVHVIDELRANAGEGIARSEQSQSGPNV
jgi:hypothetical protein